MSDVGRGHGGFGRGHGRGFAPRRAWGVDPFYGRRSLCPDPRMMYDTNTGVCFWPVGQPGGAVSGFDVGDDEPSYDLSESMNVAPSPESYLPPSTEPMDYGSQEPTPPYEPPYEPEPPPSYDPDYKPLPQQQYDPESRQPQQMYTQQTGTYDKEPAIEPEYQEPAPEPAPEPAYEHPVEITPELLLKYNIDPQNQQLPPKYPQAPTYQQPTPKYQPFPPKQTADGPGPDGIFRNADDGFRWSRAYWNPGYGNQGYGGYGYGGGYGGGYDQPEACPDPGMSYDTRTGVCFWPEEAHVDAQLPQIQSGMVDPRLNDPHDLDAYVFDQMPPEPRLMPNIVELTTPQSGLGTAMALGAIVLPALGLVSWPVAIGTYVLTRFVPGLR